MAAFIPPSRFACLTEGMRAGRPAPTAPKAVGGGEWWDFGGKALEATPGIEPGYTVLQATTSLVWSEPRPTEQPFHNGRIWRGKSGCPCEGGALPAVDAAICRL